MKRSRSFKAFINYINSNKLIENKKHHFNELKRPNNKCLSPTNKCRYNFPILHKHLNALEQIEKYQQKPFLQINLKIVGEGIKQKLLEMNENENESDNDEKKISSPVCTKKFSKSIMKKYDFKITENINKLISANNDKKNNERKSFFIHNKNYKLSENISDIGNRNEHKNNSNNEIIKLNF